MKKPLVTYIALLLIATVMTGWYQLSTNTYAGAQTLFFESVGNLFIVMMVALVVSIPIVGIAYLWAQNQ